MACLHRRFISVYLALTLAYRPRIQLNRPIRTIKRAAAHVEVTLQHCETQYFDHVIIAKHRRYWLIQQIEDGKSWQRFPFRRALPSCTPIPAAYSGVIWPGQAGIITVYEKNPTAWH